MTYVRSRRGKLVHIVTPHGTRRDLCPDLIAPLVCGRRLLGCVVVFDEEATCPACLEIESNQN
jgi:hypothetical protein